MKAVSNFWPGDRAFYNFQDLNILRLKKFMRSSDTKFEGFYCSKTVLCSVGSENEPLVSTLSFTVYLKWGTS